MKKLILLTGCMIGALLLTEQVAMAQGGYATHAQRVYSYHNAMRMTTSGGGRLADSVRNRWWSNSYRGRTSNEGWYQVRQYPRRYRAWRR